MNKDKCSGIRLGKFNKNNALNNYANLKLELNVRILGIYAAINDVTDANWHSWITSIVELIQKHVVRNLTLKGRAVLLNVKILSRIWHKATILDIPCKSIRKLNQFITTFMWKNKMHL